MTAFRTFIHRLRDECFRILNRELLFSRTITQRPLTFTWEELRDDLSHPELG